MANTIQIKRSSTSGNTPTLAAGELGVNLADSKLYVGNGSTNVLLNPSASTNYLPLTGGTLTGNLNANGLEAGVWSSNGSYKGIFHSAQTGSEYCLISNDTNTILSASTGYGVFIRGGNNVSTYQIGVYPNQLPTAGGNTILTTASGLQLSGGTLTNTSQPVLKTAYNADHYLGIGHHYIDLNFSSYTNDLELRTGGTPRLTIHRSTGNATFSGTITLASGAILTNHSTHNNYGFQIKSNDANQSALEFKDSGNNWLGTLYAAKSSSTKYIGFLDNPWGAWDVRKTVDGILEINQGSGLETVLTNATGLQLTGGTLTGSLNAKPTAQGIPGVIIGDNTSSFTAPWTSNGTDARLSFVSKNSSGGSGNEFDVNAWLGIPRWSSTGSLFLYGPNTSSGGNELAFQYNSTGWIWYVANTALLRLSPAGTLYPNSAAGVNLGASTNRWNLYATSGDFSGNLTVSGTSTFHGSLDLQDNDKLLLGAGNDLQIYHDGSHSYIKDTGTGSLYIQGGPSVQIENASGANMAVFTSGGAAELYHNNAKKFETTSYGADITGRLVTTSHIDVPDDARIRLGDGDDLQLYHDGSHSYVSDVGTGHLRLTGTNVLIEDGAGTDYIYAAGNAVTLYNAGNIKLQTQSTGVSVTGNLTASGTLDVNGSGQQMASFGNTSARCGIEIKSSQWCEIFFTNPTYANAARIGMAYSTTSTYGTSNGDWYVYQPNIDNMDLIVKRAGGVSLCAVSGNATTVGGDLTASGAATVGDSASAAGLVVKRASSGDPYIQFNKGSTRHAYIQSYQNKLYVNNDNASDIHFRTQNSDNLILYHGGTLFSNKGGDLGTNASRWSTIYGTAGNFAGSFTINNSGTTASTFYTDVGNYSSTQVLFEHTGATTPIPFALKKSGYSGTDRAFGILHLDMAHSTVGGGSNVHFTLRNSAGGKQEYAGIGGYILDNTYGSEDGALAFYTTVNGSIRQQKMTLDGTGATIENNLTVNGLTTSNGVRLGRGWHIANRAGIRLDSNGTAYPADILFGHTSAANESSWNGVYWSLSSRGTTSSPQNAFYFYRGSGHASPYNSEQIIMTFTPDLKVGINDTNPSATLDVTGTGNFSSNLTVGGNTTLTNGYLRLEAGNSVNWENENTRIVGSNTAQYIRFDVGGTSNVMYATPTGLGIGTTSPFTNLTVYGATDSRIALVNSNTGTSASDGFVLIAESDSDVHFLNREDSDMFFSTNGTKKMTILSGGNVGIGTASPSEPLEINHSNHEPVLIKSTGNYNSMITMDSNRSSANSYVGGLAGKWNGTQVASIYLRTGSDTTNKDDGYITLLTASSGTLVERIRVQADGNVGIGTASPANKLTITDGATSYTNANVLLQVKRNATNGNDDTSRAAIMLANNSNGFFIAYGGTTDRLRFIDGGDNEVLTLENGGNVGIGTASPSEALHVLSSGSDNGVLFENSNNHGNLWLKAGGNYGCYIRLENAGTANYKHHINLQANGNLYFRPNATGTENNQVVITQNGDLGVGESGPSARLDIASNDGTDHTDSTPDTLLRLRKKFLSSSDKDSAVNFDVSRYITGGNNRPRTRLDFVLSGDEGDTYDNSEPNVNVLSVRSDGRVGISQTAPSAKLHIGSSFNDAANDLGTAALAIKQTGTSAENGIYIERTGERKGYFIGISGVDGLTFRRNFSGTKSDIMSLTRAGDVGISTTSPSAKLHVGGSAIVGRTNQTGAYPNDDYDLFVGNGNSGTTILLYNNASNYHSALIKYDANCLKLGLNNNNSADSILTTTAVNITNMGVGIGVSNPSRPLQIGDGSSGNVDANGDAIYLRGDSLLGAFIQYVRGGQYNWRAGISSGSYFQINDVSQSNATRLSIAHTTGYVQVHQRLGIGVAAPSAKLHVNGAVSDILAKFVDGSDGVDIATRGSNRQQIDFLGSNTSAINAKGSLRINYDSDNNGTNDSIIFGRDGADEAGTADLVISEGSVGIGGTPSANLHVNGDSYFSSDMGIGMMASSSYRLSVSDTDNNPAQFLSTANSLNLTLGSATQTTYTNIKFNSNSGNAQIWKAGEFYYTYGGASSLNIYNSNGKIAFHPSGNANKVVINTDGDVDIADRLGVGGTHGSYTLTVNGSSYFDGQSVFDTNTGANPVYITRLGSTSSEHLSFAVEDRLAKIIHQQDEADGNHTMRFAIEGAINHPDVNKHYEFNKDNDVNFYMGRCRLGYVGHSDYAGFAHYDHANASSYGFLQGYQGATFINSAAGQTIYFRQANANVGGIVSGNWGLGTISPGSYRLYVNGTSYFSGAAEFDGGIKDKDGSLGTNGHVLHTNGSDVYWAAASGGSGSGTVNSGTAEQMAFYASSGTAVSGTSAFTFENSTDQEFNIGDGSSKGELCIGGAVGATSNVYRLFVNGSIKATALYDKSNTAHYIAPSQSGISSQVEGGYAMANGGGSYNTGYGVIYANSSSMPYWYDGSGNNYSIYVSSDYRLKSNVEAWDSSTASSLVKGLNVYSFDWNEKGQDLAVTNDTSRVGFLAHEVKEKIPHNRLVAVDKDATDENGEPIYQTVDQAGMVPILWAALQDALKRIEQLEAR